MKNGILITIGVAVWAALKGAAKLLKILITLLTEIVIFFGLYIPLFYLLFGLILLATTTFSLGGTGTDQIIYYVGLGASCIAAVIIAIRNSLVRPLSAIFAPIAEFFRSNRDRKRAQREELEGDYPYENGDYRGAPLRDGYGQAHYGVDPRDLYRAPAYDDRARYDDDGYDERLRPTTPAAYPAYGGYERAYPRDPYYYRSERVERATPYAEHSAPVGTPSSDRYVAPAEYNAPSSYEGGASRFDAPSPRAPEAERPLLYYSERRPGILVMEYSDRFELYREDENGRVYVGTEYKDE